MISSFQRECLTTNAEFLQSVASVMLASALAIYDAEKEMAVDPTISEQERIYHAGRVAYARTILWGGNTAAVAATIARLIVTDIDWVLTPAQYETASVENRESAIQVQLDAHWNLFANVLPLPEA
jgi:hypothetical protein